VNKDEYINCKRS